LKILALDYGSARTGVAVSDPTGTVARPLCVVRQAAGEAGLTRLRELVREEGAERVVVGLPLTLRGARGRQAAETERFVEGLRAVVEVPVETFDERFTTALAGRDRSPASSGKARRRGTPLGEGEDARAAAHLLSTYLEWSSRRS
jgi:putative transcription antitermination factor YqgF